VTRDASTGARGKAVSRITSLRRPRYLWLALLLVGLGACGS